MSLMCSLTRFVEILGITFPLSPLMIDVNLLLNCYSTLQWSALYINTLAILLEPWNCYLKFNGTNHTGHHMY